MRVQVIDEQALASPAPRSIRLYLRMHNWQRQTETSATPDVWTLLTEDGMYEIIAPSSRQVRDYSQRVAELLRTLAITEGRSELDLLRDLTAVPFDIQYVHTHFSSFPGAAPLHDVADAFNAAQAMLSASTASLEEPRLVLPPRRPRLTTDLMQKVLAGPTSEGSYVISIWVPVPPRLTQDEDLVLFDDSSEPFERRATKHLNQSLLAARAAASEALDTDAGIDAFVTRETSGISANLCEALVSLSGKEAVGFDVRFAWSLDRPVAGIVPRISFNEESIPVLREAARELREKLPEDEVRLRGNVVRLHREGQLGHGEVTIAGSLVGDPLGKLRRVSLDLAQSDYGTAIQAHRSFADVEVVGSLIQRGTRTYLTNTRDFVELPPAG